MRRLTKFAAVLGLVLLYGASGSLADSPSEPALAPSAGDTGLFPLLAPPATDGPVVVRSAFELNDIVEVDEVAETFEITGALRLTWNDPRQAFEPSAGAEEKVFQGAYQFNELSTGWYPEVVLANESGGFQTGGVVLRVRPDGTSTLIRRINATAEADLDMRWYPFDAHRLEAVFAVLGFGKDEVVLEADPVPRSIRDGKIQIPQWTLQGVEMSIRDQPGLGPDGHEASSAFVVSIDVERKSFYLRRLVSFPLSIIVLLSFCVFWMDRSSLADRISVSFIGILTGVTYQLMMVDVMPPISYVTLMHGFLFVSFLTMCATVVANLTVGALDKKGSYELGDLIDRRCRWAFPLAYFSLVLGIFGAAKVLFV
jgi:hypothetical protein